jgi:hypothetical protein
MKTPIMTLAVLLGVAAGAAVGSDAWAARPAQHHHHAASSKFRHGLRTAAFHRLGAPESQQGAVVERAAYSQDEAGPTDRPGMFKTHDAAGWGVAEGGGQAAVGFYKRPEETGVPAPQMYQHEGRGAAGLSFSMKLGG